MLRALAVLLLLANLIFFAWARGWLAPALPPPHAGEREPERLAAQVHPEAIQVLAGPAASAALLAATPKCLEAGPLADADVAAVEAALAAAGIASGAWTRQDVAQPTVWLVYMGRYTDAGALRTKEDELKRLKLAYDEVRAPPELAPGLALSRHDSRAAADAALAQASQHGVRTARVVALPTPPAQHWLRAPRADSGQQARLLALAPPAIAAPFGPCASRP